MDNKKNKFLRNLLTTASIASVVIGGSSTAAAANGMITTQNDAVTSQNHFDQATVVGGAAGAAGAVFTSGKALIFGANNAWVNVVVDQNNVVFQALDLANVNRTLQLNGDNITIGSIGSVTVGNAGHLSITFGAACHKLTLTGKEAKAAQHGFILGENEYAKLKSIDFAAAAGDRLNIVRIQPSNPSDIEFAALKITRGQNARIEVLNDQKSVTFKHESVASVKEIHIEGKSTVIFDTDETAAAGAGALHLQHWGGSKITLDKEATLHLKSQAGANKAHDFKVIYGSLGGDTDGHGIIHFDTSAVAGKLSAATASTPVIGQGRGNTTNKFIVTAAGANSATIASDVYTTNLELNAGAAPSTIIFEKDLYVKSNTSLGAANPANVRLNLSGGISALGTMDFKNAAAQISVANKGTLEGKFSNTRAAGAGINYAIINFNGNGTLIGDVGDGINIVQAAADGGILTFSKGIRTGNLNLAKTHYILDKYKVTGNIDGVVAAAPAPAWNPNLNVQGDSEVTGSIGNAEKVADITVAKDKILTVSGAVIKSNNLFLGGAGTQGTLKLNGTGVVTVDSRISMEGGGTIDATAIKPQAAVAPNLAVPATLIIKGAVGANPKEEDAAALEKLLIKEQKVQFDVAAGQYINIAEIDSAGSASVIVLDKTGVSYRLGKLISPNALVIEVNENVSLFNTKTVDKDGKVTALKEIAFDAAAAAGTPGTKRILTLVKGNDLMIGNVKNPERASFILADDSTLRGGLGKPDSRVSDIIVRKKANLLAGQYYVENVTLEKDSLLTVDTGFTAGRISGKEDGEGTLRLTSANKDNKNPLLVKISDPSAAPAPVAKATATPAPTVATVTPSAQQQLSINGIEVSGAVKLVKEAAKTGLKFTNIKFIDNGILTLAEGITNVSVDSLVDISAQGVIPPKLHLTGKNVFGNGTHVGTEAKYAVNIELGADVSVDAATKKFFAAVTTDTNNTGSFTSSGDEDVSVGGLGSEKLKLARADFNTNTQNLGDTYVTQATLSDGKTYTAGKKVVTDKLQVGTASGGAKIKLLDGVNIDSTLTSVGANNTIRFAGDAQIKGNIGTEAARFASINFDGTGEKTVKLDGAHLYSQADVDFGKQKVSLSADSSVNCTSKFANNIDLGTHKLTLDKAEFNDGTSIKTELKGEKLGSIKAASLLVKADVPTEITVEDNDPLKGDKKYEFIEVDQDLTPETVDKFKAKSTNNYAKLILADGGKKLMLVRKDVTEEVIEKDGEKSEYKPDPEKTKLFKDSDTGSFAEKDFAGIATIEKPGDRNDAQLQRTEVTSAQEAHAVDQAVASAIGGIQNLVAGRTLSTDKPAMSSGSDDAVSMGAWIRPYYAVAEQNDYEAGKDKGTVLGYTSRSAGGVLGFDGLATDELTIGAAVGYANTNMKYKAYRKDTTTAINTWLFSLYGVQQIDQSFFVSGVGSLALHGVETTDPRTVSKKTNAEGKETAKAKYDYKSYGGELSVGYNAKVSDALTLTPTIGVRYTGSTDAKYKESGTTNTNKDITRASSNRFDAVIGARITSSIDSNGVTILPEAHASVIQKLGGENGKVESKIEGMKKPWIDQAKSAGNTVGNIGVGLGAKSGSMEYGIGYDAYIAAKYLGHQGTLKVRVNF